MLNIVIHKYLLDLNSLSIFEDGVLGVVEIEMHEGATFLSFQNQLEQPYLWVLEDVVKPKGKFRFQLVLTGFSPEVDPITGRDPATLAGYYIGTALFEGGRFVVHLFHYPYPSEDL